MNSRIKSSNVQLGDSLIIGQKNKDKKNMTSAELLEEEQKEKEKEFQKALEGMLLEASNQGRAFIEESQKKASEIIHKANEDFVQKSQEAEVLKQQSLETGHAEGFKTGYDEGLANAKEQIRQEVWGLGVLATATFNVKKEIINSAEKDILELSTMIAEKIIRQQLELRPEQMQAIIKSAIDQLKDKEQIKLIVNPQLTENLYNFTEEIKETVKGLKSIKITENKTIPRNGVIVESPDSRIDGRIETQLQELVKELMLVFAENSNAESLPKEITVKIDDSVAEVEKTEKDKETEKDK